MNYGRGAMGPDLATNLPPGNSPNGFVNGRDMRRQMPQVNNPCDLWGPLARGSSWPYEVLIYPGAARPAYAATFNIYRELEVTVADTWVTVADIELGKAEEGRVLQWAGEEEGAVGSDLFWRIVQDESQPGRYDVMRGGWSRIDLPQQIITPIPHNTLLALQVLLPAAGGTPRTVRALLRGWTAPSDGGGTFAGGFAR